MTRLSSSWLLTLLLLSIFSVSLPGADNAPVKNEKAATSTSGSTDKIRFNRDVRPIMSDTCFHCHGPDKNARKADLRLDEREAALKPAESGEIPIVPGKPEQSEIIKRIFTTDKDTMMPPPDAHKTLTAAQKEIFRRWVAEGAEYEAHWAYTPLTRTAVPQVTDAVSKFAGSNAVDAFILEKLATQNIQPSPAADRRTLLRRLSLDLIGLPPTPEELDAFVADKSDNAYEKQVDRLLNSVHFGERMAVWWLDVARFADTVGFHGDQNQRIFPYRDYVIQAFNQNKPFDQFTVEQLAGDLLPNPTPEQLIATGFNRLNMMTREGGAQPKEYLAKYNAERVRTVGGAWMGATLGCCECHNHKFDPFTARDFYSMQAFFADMKQWGVYATYGYTPNPELAGFTNDHPFPPELLVDSQFLQRRIARLSGRLGEVARQAVTQFDHDPALKTKFQQWLTESQTFAKANPSGWSTPTPQVTLAAATQPKNRPAGKTKPNEKDKPTDKPEPAAEPFQVQADGRIVFANLPADKTTVSLEPTPGWVSAVRIELLPDESHQGSILRNGSHASDRLTLQASLTKAAPSKATANKDQSNKSQPLPFRHADADHKEPEYRNGGEILGIIGEWRTAAAAWNKAQTAVCIFDKPVRIEAGDSLAIQLDNNLVGALRISVSPFVPADPGRGGSLEKVTQEISKANALHTLAQISNGVLEAWLTGTRVNEQALSQYAKLYTERMECHGGQAWTMVTQAVAQPQTIRILARGNWMDESGAIVQPATPGCLPALPAKEGVRLTRLDLAHWLCSRENPTTPRAIVNRWWKQFFGNGLSMVVDDLGAQGEPPSHPELLDWLAAEFRDSGWNVKHTLKILVMSNTYQQSSNLRPELRDQDPNNRWLASQNPRRLEAEFVRDNALSIAGLLNLDVGGPSVKPYQPAGYYANIQFPDRHYVADTDDRQWRRGVYMHWQRTFLHPMLANFDAPLRDECTANRTCSNTPQQALTLLNDPSFVEAARAFAARLFHEISEDDTAKLQRAFVLAVGRPPKDAEQKALQKFLASQREYFKSQPQDAEKLTHVGVSTISADNAQEWAAWTEVCRVILNLHESITRY